MQAEVTSFWEWQHQAQPIVGVTFEKIDFLDGDAPARLKALVGGPADMVMSDMAPNTTCHRETDH